MKAGVRAFPRMMRIEDCQMQKSIRKSRQRKHSKKNPSHLHNAPPEGALLVSIEQTAALLNRSVSFIFDLMRDGELKALKSGRRTVIPTSELHRYIASLPARGPGEFSGKSA